MSDRWSLVAVGILVAGIIAAACLRPTAMLAPGRLSAEHRTLGEDCFACHQPGHGATSSRCLSCHRLAEIGLRDTHGRPLPARTSRVGFHQHLAKKNCVACHTAHAGSVVAMPRKTFTHALLEPHASTRCSSCHQAPQDGLHRNFDAGCANCHRQQGWRPATFDHTRWFPLSGDHAASCSTCHQQVLPGEGKSLRRKFKVYTCFGCHEHRENRMRAEHAEEGIHDLTDCVRCHRNGREEGEGESED